MAPGAPTPRWTSLREWGIRPKLIIVLAIPTLAALSLGAVEMIAALNQTAAYSKVVDISNAGRKVSTLVVALQAERDLNADRIARRRDSLPAVNKQMELVDRAAADVRTGFKSIDSSYDPVVRRDVDTALAALNDLSGLRARTSLGFGPAASIIEGYTAIIAPLLRVNANLWVGSDDAAFVQRVASMVAVSRAAELASQQRALLDVALNAPGFRGTGLADLISARGQQQATITAFLASATDDDADFFRRTVTGPDVDRATSVLNTALAQRSSNNIGADAYEWYLLKSEEVDRVNRVAFHQLEQITARAQELRSVELLGAVRAGLIIMLILLFALAATVVVARSMIRPLQRLRSAAFEVADRGLPEVVRRLHEGEAQDFDASVRPVEVATRDEIGQVARAFDEVHAQAVRLAGEQALMRKSMSAMFVNLSRRSQSLVERQLRVIDELETSEQDPDQLASLFTLDLLATRMRRNDENLLVLAGAEGGRRWATPVALLDVVRAAVAEVEQYARVRTDVQGGYEIVSTAVGGVVHLLAELLENAASFSAPGTPVDIRARSLGASGEIMIEVEDQGIGMTASQMAQANERLAAPPAFDVSASRMMGLYVVARLAQRHDIKVRLRSSPNSGVIALVQLPARIVLFAGAAPIAGAPSDTALAQPEIEPMWAAGFGSNGSMPHDVRPPDVRPHDARPPDFSPADVRPPEVRPYNVHPQDVRPHEPVSRDPGPVMRPAPAQEPNASPLPIFDTIQSEWFSRPLDDYRAPAPTPSPGPSLEPAAAPADTPTAEPVVARRGWSSPADEGWRVAQAASKPVSGGVTQAGLPIRVRGSNLVPGQAATNAPASSARPAHAARGLSSFQRGVARGRTGDAVPSPPDSAATQSVANDPAERQHQEEARP